MPVSSQLVSMPSTRGSVRFTCRLPRLRHRRLKTGASARQDATAGISLCRRKLLFSRRRVAPPTPADRAHHDRVHVIGLVVPRPPADLDEPLRGVQRLGDRVVRAHFEEDVPDAAPRRLLEKLPQQRPAPAPAPCTRGDRDRLDVGIPRPARRAQPGVADQSARLFDDDVPAVPGGELFAHHGVRPGVGGEGFALECHDRRRGRPRWRAAGAHAVTRFGPCGIVTSGERRYSGSVRAGTRPAAIARPATIATIAAGMARASRRCGAERRQVRIQLVARDERGLGGPHGQAVVIDAVVHREGELPAPGIGHDGETRRARRR